VSTEPPAAAEVGARHPSPDGRYAVVTTPWDVRMSIWIDTPHIEDQANDTIVMSLHDVHWSLVSATWQSPAVVLLMLRKYPGSHQPPELKVVVDCDAKVATLDGRSMSVRDIEPALEAALAWPGSGAPAAGAGTGAVEASRVQRLLYAGSLAGSVVTNAVAIVFFVIGIGDGTVSSFNIVLWVALLAGAGCSLWAGRSLRARGRFGPAIAALSVSALPALVGGLFLLMLLVTQPRWN
jgi:hypothetical protein